MQIPDNELLRYCSEDIRYQDLTTTLQEGVGVQARLSVYTRQPIRVSASEEAARIAKLHGCRVVHLRPSGTDVRARAELITLEGAYEQLHMLWRSMQNLLEYSCAIATQTAVMAERIQKQNQNCQLLATRKTIPFAKQMCVNAIHSGGGQMHRLGLDESVLFFANHRVLYAGRNDFYEKIAAFKAKLPEKKIMVEAKDTKDAFGLLEHGASGVQLDKMDTRAVKEVVAFKQQYFSNAVVLAAGGINPQNAAEYAATGVDGIVSSSMYTAGLADLGCSIEVL